MARKSNERREAAHLLAKAAMQEAQKVLDLARASGEFMDCQRLPATRKQVKARVIERAEEVLADQYPMLRVRVQEVSDSFGIPAADGRGVYLGIRPGMRPIVELRRKWQRYAQSPKEANL
jgi:hypothetical protein